MLILLFRGSNFALYVSYWAYTTFSEIQADDVADD
jgi:hypothetical protein